MNNLQTNNRRLVRKNESIASEGREHSVSAKADTMRKPRNHSSGMVLQAFSTVGAPREPGHKRHYNSYAGIDEATSDRGGQTHVR